MTERDRKLTETVTRERGRLLNFIRRWVPEPSDAEDILQDVFFELVDAYRLPHPIEQAGAWLFRVARNRIIDRFRKKKVTPPLLASPDDNSAAPGDAPQPESGDDPETAYACAVLTDEFLAALDELPAEQRSVFIAHVLEGQSFKALSAQTGVGVNTLLSRKRYAVLHLRERLQTLYDDFMN